MLRVIFASLFMLAAFFVSPQISAAHNPLKCESWVLSSQLKLRLLEVTDQEALLEFLAIEQIQHDLVATEENIAASTGALSNLGRPVQVDRHRKETIWLFGIFDETRLIGLVSARVINSEPASIGYALHPDYWRQGYATEAVTQVLNFLFLPVRDIHLVNATTAVDNEPSQRLLLRLGFSVSRYQNIPGHIRFTISHVRWRDRR